MIVLDPLIRIAIIAIDIYVWLVIASAVLSWLVHFGVVNRSNQVVSTIGEFLWRITEPALRPLRRYVPNFGGVDITPVILLLILWFTQMVLVNIRFSLIQG